MKELSIEEKAKAYDKVREKIAIRFGSNVADEIFSKFEMSEDERIRKELIEHIKANACADYVLFKKFSPDDVIAWLEKQREQTISENYKQAEKEKRDAVGYGFMLCKGDILDFKEGESYWLEYIGDDKYNVRSDNLLGRTYHLTPMQFYLCFRPLTWLEKQGDNTYSWKPTEEQYEALDYAYNNCPDTEMGNYVEGVLETLIDDLYKLSEKQGEQKVTFTSIVETGNGGINALVTKELPTDKIEPKFKVGDWIVFNGFVLHIDEIVDGYYRTTSKGGITNSYDWDIDNAARLWAIQDAKDGDVLRLGCIIAMFKKYIGQEKCICYCSISEDGDFEIPIENGEDNVYGCTDTTPATKEQRDTLMKAMADAGYEFDFKEKVLKKIEQKSAWSEEDEELCNILMNICGGPHDEMDRRPWAKCINWLKSLKDRYIWKPSDEQIEALNDACEEHWEPDGLEPLYTLYQDLKKLREE